MARASELGNRLRAIMEAYDHSDPEAWSRLMARLLTNEDPAGLWAQVPQNPNVAEFRGQYLRWKDHVASRTIPGGQAFQRSFWTRLADPRQRQSLAGLDLSAADSPETLLQALDAQPTEVLIGFHASDQFANTCVVQLMGEAMALFGRRELTEAEQLNDSGFDRHHSGGYAEALPLHEQAIRLSPKFALAWINKGIALKNLGRYDEAIACYDHVIKDIDAEYKKAWHNKAVALKMKGRLREAIECLDGAIRLDPQYEAALRVREDYRRQLLAESAPPSEAVAKGVEELQKNPQLAQLLAMAENLEQRGMWEQAARLWERALPLASGHPPFPAAILVSLGNALYEAGHREEALAKFRAALDNDPGCGEAWMNIARYHLDQEDSQSALEAAEKATKYSPDNSMAWANRAGALGRLRRFDEAVEAARRAVDLDDRNIVATFNLGTCLWQLGRIAEARERLQAVMRMAPDHPGARLARQILDSL